MFSRIGLLSLGALLPLVLSFRLCADPLAPKQALWGIAGGILLASPALTRFRSEPALFILLALAGAMSLAAGTGFSSLLPWIVGAAVFLHARESGARFAGKYARLAAATAALIALYALSQSAWNRIFTGIRLVNPFGERVPGTLGNPTFLADYLAAFLPVSLTLMSLARPRSGRGLDPSGWTRPSAAFYIWGAASLATFAAIILSGSKGGQLAAIIGGTGWALIFLRVMPPSRRRVLIPASVILFVLGILAVTPSAFMQSISRWTSSSQRFSFTQRIDILRGTGRLVARSPLVGHGPGTFPALFPRENPASLAKSLGLTLSVNHAHNDYAETASDLGLAGLVLLIFILFRRIPSALKPGLGAGFALSTVSLGASMATNFALFLPSSAFFIWMHAGLSAPGKPAQPSRFPLLTRVLLSLAALFAGFLSVQTLLANAYMRPGQEALEAGNGPRAESFLGKAVLVSPPERHIFQLLGRSKEIQGKSGEAAAAYDSAWRLAPYLPITAFNVARVQREIFLRSGSRDRAALARAVGALQSAILANPYLTDAREWGGELAMQSGDSAVARRFLLEIPPDLAPLSPQLHNLRARLYSSEGKGADAERERQMAREQEGRRTISEAEYLMKQGKMAEAEKLARETVKINPNLGAGWELLGYLLHTRGALPESRRCYQRLEILEPGSLAAQLNLTLLSLRAGDRINARLHLEKARIISPISAEVLLAGARVLAFEGNKPESLAEYRKLIGLYPDNDQARAELRALEAR